MRVKTGLGIKIVLTVLLVIITFSCGMFFGFYRLSTALYESRSDVAGAYTKITGDIVAYAQAAQASGQWSRDEAMKRAAEIVDSINLGETGSLIILGSDGRVIADTSSPASVGKPLDETEKADDFPPFQTIKALAESTNQGKLRFGDTILRVTSLQPWGWIVGSALDSKKIVSDMTRTLTVIGIVCLVFTVATWIVLFMIIRSIYLPFNRLAEEMHQCSEITSQTAVELLDASHLLADGTARQAASIEETSATLQEIGSQATENAGNSRKTDELAGATTDSVTRGAEAISKLGESIADIEANGEEIAKIAQGIEGIAFQTNLLALNAAVEAARAGDAGLGFAVVAGEVRNLAQRAAEQAKMATDLVIKSRGSIQEGKQRAQYVVDGFESIQSQSFTVAEIIRQISFASTEQSRGVEQINNAMAEMEKIVQQNLAMSQQTDAASEKMLMQSGALNEIVSQLMLVIKGESRLPAAPVTHGRRIALMKSRDTDEVLDFDGAAMT